MKRWKNARLLAVLAAAVLAAAGLGGCGKQEADLLSLVEITYSGLDGEGQAVAVLDPPPQALEALGEDAQALLDTVRRVKVEPWQGLSNGDEITLALECSPQAAEELGYRLKDTSRTVTVSGLQELRPVDLFQGVEVTFSGVAPFGEAVATWDGSGDPFLEQVVYNVQPNQGLSNGDTVTVSAKYLPWAAEDALCRPKADTKTFTVEGLDHYLAQPEELTAQALDTLDQDARALLTAKFSVLDEGMLYDLLGYTHDQTGTIGEPTPAAAYLLTAKGEGYGANYGNLLVLVYRAQLDLVNGEKWALPQWDRYTGEAYFPVAYPNLVVDGAGQVSADTAARLFQGQATTLEEVHTAWALQYLDRYEVQELPPQQLGWA